MMPQSTKWDRPPAWSDLSTASPATIEALGTLTYTATLFAVRSAKTIATEVARHIIKLWSSDRSIAKQVSLKAVLDTAFLTELLELKSHHICLALVQRHDVSPTLLISILESHLYLNEHGGHELVCEIIKHPLCPPTAITFLYQSSYPPLLDVISGAREIPLDVQQVVLQRGSFSQKKFLLYHESVNQELIQPLIDSLVKCGIPDFITHAIFHSRIQRPSLTTYLFSPEVKIASAAAERASEVAGLLRIRTFAKHHTGHQHAAMCTWLTDSIARGRPLGLFVALSFFYRAAYAGRPDEFLALVKVAYNTPASQSIRHAADADQDLLSSFMGALSFIPLGIRKRLLMNALFTGHLNYENISAFIRLSASMEFVSTLSQIKWRRIRTFGELVVRMRQLIELREVKRKLLRPFAFAPWLRHIDGERTTSGHIFVVPKTAKSLLSLGIDLTVCLADQNQEYSQRVSKGRSAIFGLKERGGRTVYAFQLTVDGTRIEQAKGPYNTEVPPDVVDAVKAMIAEALQAFKT